MPIVTRATASSLPSAASKEDDICAICCHTMGDDRVKTYCGHEFHGQCLVNSLQYKRQCPMCRHVPAPPGRAAELEPNDELYDSGVMEDVQGIIGTRLERFTKPFLQQMLGLFNIPAAETGKWTKDDCIATVAEQLVYETDSDGEGDDDEDEDDDEIMDA